MSIVDQIQKLTAGATTEEPAPLDPPHLEDDQDDDSADQALSA